MVYIEQIERTIPAHERAGEFARLAAALQHGMLVHLARRTERAIQMLLDDGPLAHLCRSPIRTLVFTGGCAANNYWRRGLGHLCANYGLRMSTPPPHLCGDNGVMIAHQAVLMLKHAPVDTITIRPEEITDDGFEKHLANRELIGDDHTKAVMNIRWRLHRRVKLDNVDEWMNDTNVALSR
jgi:tRNA A37 threonylcarbamoyltransferase TsaD